jgi:hypothetical protein
MRCGAEWVRKSIAKTQGKREPAGAFLARVKRFLKDGDEAGARRAG